VRAARGSPKAAVILGRPTRRAEVRGTLSSQDACCSGSLPGDDTRERPRRQGRSIVDHLGEQAVMVPCSLSPVLLRSKEFRSFDLNLPPEGAALRLRSGAVATDCARARKEHRTSCCLGYRWQRGISRGFRGVFVISRRSKMAARVFHRRSRSPVDDQTTNHAAAVRGAWWTRRVSGSAHPKIPASRVTRARRGPAIFETLEQVQLYPWEPTASVRRAGRVLRDPFGGGLGPTMSRRASDPGARCHE